MNTTKEKTIGYVSSAIVCGLLVWLLYLLFLHTKVNAEEQGILVNFGTVDWAAGTFEPSPEGDNRVVPTEEAAPYVKPVPAVKNPPVITQSAEQTAAINAAKQKAEQQRLEREKQEAEKRRLAEEQRKRDAINQQMAGAFGTGNTPHGNEGTASSGAGNQGSSQGNSATGSHEGYGGFDLTGRSIGSGGLPIPAYSAQYEGKIVIAIVVNPKGEVISAEIGRGTTITNASMRTDALGAARKARFNTITGANNQSGTITYNYKLN